MTATQHLSSSVTLVVADRELFKIYRDIISEHHSVYPESPVASPASTIGAAINAGIVIIDEDISIDNRSIQDRLMVLSRLCTFIVLASSPRDGGKMARKLKELGVQKSKLRIHPFSVTGKTRNLSGALLGSIYLSCHNLAVDRYLEAYRSLALRDHLPKSPAKTVVLILDLARHSIDLSTGLNSRLYEVVETIQRDYFSMVAKEALSFGADPPIFQSGDQILLRFSCRNVVSGRERSPAWLALNTVRRIKNEVLRLKELHKTIYAPFESELSALNLDYDFHCGVAYGLCAFVERPGNSLELVGDAPKFACALCNIDEDCQTLVQKEVCDTGGELIYRDEDVISDAENGQTAGNYLRLSNVSFDNES